MKQDPRLSDAIAAIRKQHGKGAIMSLGDKEGMDVPVIPSGSLAIDIALGIGGYPRGRIIEIFGPESGGKTTATLHAIAQAQKAGGQAAFIDAEHALDPNYARALGVDVDNLLISQPDNGEQALEIAESLIKSDCLDIIVVDSVAALVPKSELDGEMGQAQMGVQARMMSQAMRKLTAITSKSRTCLIFINQIREKIGVMFGSPETTTGGRALKFYTSVRLDIRRTSTNKVGDVKTGNQTRIRVVKNKLAAPFKEAEVTIIFGEGISNEIDILSHAIENHLLDRSGSWYSMGEIRIGQGEEQARIYLKEHPDVTAVLEKKLRSIYFPSKEVCQTKSVSDANKQNQ